jgi:hypothetical protein
MYPNFSSQIAQARIADRHRRAEQDALARAACQGRRPPKRQPGIRVPRLAVIDVGRVLTAWAART